MLSSSWISSCATRRCQEAPRSTRVQSKQLVSFIAVKHVLCSSGISRTGLSSREPVALTQGIEGTILPACRSCSGHPAQDDKVVMTGTAPRLAMWYVYLGDRHGPWFRIDAATSLCHITSLRRTSNYAPMSSYLRAAWLELIM